MPEVAIVSTTLLWEMMNTITGTDSVTTDAAAAAPYRDTPLAMICDSA